MNEKISRVLDIPIEITAILGRTKMSLNEILELGRGSLIELDTLENQEVEILVNGKKIAYACPEYLKIYDMGNRKNEFRGKLAK